MVSWRDMKTAPRDGTFLRLLVQFTEHDLEDHDESHGPRPTTVTIGFNNLDNTEEDLWQFAGWDWCQDVITEGRGTPIGWLPLTLEGDK